MAIKKKEIDTKRDVASQKIQESRFQGDRSHALEREKLDENRAERRSTEHDVIFHQVVLVSIVLALVAWLGIGMAMNVGLDELLHMITHRLAFPLEYGGMLYYLPSSIKSLVQAVIVGVLMVVLGASMYAFGPWPMKFIVFGGASLAFGSSIFRGFLYIGSMYLGQWITYRMCRRWWKDQMDAFSIFIVISYALVWWMASIGVGYNIYSTDPLNPFKQYGWIDWMWDVLPMDALDRHRMSMSL